MTYVESAKNKEHGDMQVADQSIAYQDFASGVAVASVGQTAIKHSSPVTTSSSSSCEETVEAEARTSHGKTKRTDSDSSTMSNEEIVRQHLTKASQDVNMSVVTAKEKRRQYNSITEKYVNNAIKEELVQSRNEDVKPLEKKDTEMIKPVVVDPEGYRRALDSKRGDNGNLTHVSGDSSGDHETHVRSHTELMKEHFNDSNMSMAGMTRSQSGKIDQYQPANVSEQRYLDRQHFTTEATGHEVIDVNKNNDMADEKTVRKKYIITQQEIVFYIRNADGTIRIVNRPLITGEKIYGSLRKRHNSQPSLHSDDEKGGGDGGLGHIRDVGNINQETTEVTNQHKRVIEVQNKQWKSSGSIFDCEQKCFSDDTMVI